MTKWVGSVSSGADGGECKLETLGQKARDAERGQEGIHTEVGVVLLGGGQGASLM